MSQTAAHVDLSPDTLCYHEQTGTSIRHIQHYAGFFGLAAGEPTQ
jgi:hypothetical protein